MTKEIQMIEELLKVAEDTAAGYRDLMRVIQSASEKLNARMTKLKQLSHDLTPPTC